MANKMVRLGVAVAMVLTAAGCGGMPAGVVTGLAPAVLSADTIATLRSSCSRAAPLLALAQSSIVPPQAREIAAVVAPYCASLAAGQVPATTDANTPTWLPANLAGLARALGMAF